MLFVRTEAAENVFVTAQDRVVYTRRYPAADPLPEGWELEVDADAAANTERLERELVKAEAEAEGLAEAMRAAVGLLPVPVANEMRGRYREARQEALLIRSRARRERKR
jgi:hypothetical protein